MHATLPQCRLRTLTSTGLWAQIVPIMKWPVSLFQLLNKRNRYLICKSQALFLKKKEKKRLCLKGSLLGSVIRREVIAWREWQRCQSQACSHTSFNACLSVVHKKPSWTLECMAVPVQQWVLRKWAPLGLLASRTEMRWGRGFGTGVRTGHGHRQELAYRNLGPSIKSGSLMWYLLWYMWQSLKLGHTDTAGRETN